MTNRKKIQKNEIEALTHYFHTFLIELLLNNTLNKLIIEVFIKLIVRIFVISIFNCSYYSNQWINSI